MNLPDSIDFEPWLEERQHRSDWLAAPAYTICHIAGDVLGKLAVFGGSLLLLLFEHNLVHGCTL